jgi:hypothetical protein
MNIYAFLLLGLGAAVFFVPMDIFLIILKSLVVLWCAAGAVIILSQWKQKKRKMAVLLARNRNEVRPDTFKQLSGTLCGQLMIQSTLAALRKSETYRDVPTAEWKAYRDKAFQKSARGKRHGN